VSNVGSNIEAVLDALFHKAKSVDEFEYAMSLLRPRGMETLGWDPLIETDELVADMVSLMQAPLQPFTQVRLGLLTYCHLIEVDTIYNILANLLLTIAGQRAHIDPLAWEDSPTLTPQKRNEISPGSVAHRVKELCARSRTLGEVELAAIISKMYNNKVRNAFFHADYVLFQDEFRTPGGTAAPIKLELLANQINKSILFYHAFRATYLAHRQSYTEPKTVKSRICGDETQRVDVTLLADEARGLYGFSGSVHG
jgi:hypothetical protein